MLAPKHVELKIDLRQWAAGGRWPEEDKRGVRWAACSFDVSGVGFNELHSNLGHRETKKVWFCVLLPLY